MKLSEEEKADRAKKRMLATARQYTTGTYKTKHVAPIFQRMIRAEWAAISAGPCASIVNDKFTVVFRHVGECVCVTCGATKPWSGGGKTRLGGMHTGHFIASRRNSILFDEANVAPQCAGCNVYKGGAPQQFRMWMDHVRPHDIDRLYRLKSEIRQFSLEELVDLRIGFMARLKAAEEHIEDS